MGYAFTYPLVHYFTDAKIATYTHYPTISSDMVNRVYERRAAHNNDAKFASSTIWSTGKLMYEITNPPLYKIEKFMYFFIVIIAFLHIFTDIVDHSQILLW